MIARAIHLATSPIDDDARNGRYQLVIGERGVFAVVRWDCARWVFSSNHPLDFEPTGYRRG